MSLIYVPGEKIKQIKDHVFYLSEPPKPGERRENMIVMWIADRGEGKTWQFIHEVIPAYFRKGMKVHIVLTKPNKFYRELEASKHPLIEFHYTTNISIIRGLLNNTYNEVWCFEDSKSVFDTKLDKETRDVIIDSRMRNVDTYFMYQAWGWTCMDVMRVCDAFIMGRSSEDCGIRKDVISAVEIEIFRTYTPQLKQHETYTVVR